MYGIPKDFDGQFIKDSVLEMICFSSNQIYFHFSKDILITLESSYSYYEKGKAPDELITVPVKKSNLMELLEKSVVEVYCTTAGILKLCFENNMILEFFDTTENFESYQIKYKNEIFRI